ncbi:MAG: hypothetical protein ABR562_09025, partial [Thermoplasmatota archaeon]
MDGPSTDDFAQRQVRFYRILALAVAVGVFISFLFALGMKNVPFQGIFEQAALQRGLFLAFQYPHAIPGVTVTSFLRSAINAIRKAKNGGKDDPIG